MLLRRITQHVKAQNWTAVALDFVIVVVGVFIGIQVANWNDGLAEKTAFERQLSTVRVEMVENLARFEESRTSLEQQLADIAELRAVLSEPENSNTEERLNDLLFQSILVFGIYPKRHALDRVLASDMFSTTEDINLSDAMEQWDVTLAYLTRQQQDELNYRDGFQLPYFSQHLSTAAVFGAALEDEGILAPARFGHKQEDLAADPVVENALAIRQLTTNHDLTNTSNLIAHTELIISLIEARGK